jgi:hypothetical protein
VGKLEKGAPGEVFAAWFVQAAIWGVPAAVLSIMTVTLLLIAAERPMLYRDATIVLDIASFGITAITIGGFFALPFVMIGGITAGITAAIVTWFFRPGERPRAYSITIRLIVGIVTTVVVVFSVFGALFEQGDWSFSDEATTRDWLVWFGPIVAIAFGAVWISGRTAVARSMKFLVPFPTTEAAPESGLKSMGSL